MENFSRTFSLLRILLIELLVMFFLGVPSASFLAATLGGWEHEKEKLNDVGGHLFFLAMGLILLARFVYRVAWPKHVVEELRKFGTIRWNFTTNDPLYLWVDLGAVLIAALFLFITLGTPTKGYLTAYWWTRMMMGISLSFPIFRLLCWYGLKRQIDRLDGVWISLLWMMGLFFIPFYLALSIALIH